MGAAAGGEGEAAVRVLVVDDSPVDRRVVELLLRNHAAAFHVTSVDSGKKAMELLRLNNAQGKQQGSIDVVLTDYCMPEMTGYDLLQAIKALGSANPIPVVVMSSENEPQRISRCLTAGAQDFLVKPLRTKDVQRLRNRSSISKRNNAPPMKAAASEQRLADLAMAALKASSSVELSRYMQLLLKLILLAYALLCLAELLHRCSNGCFLSLSLIG